MADPYIGQISIVGFNFAPTSFASCDGQLMAISQNQALFALLGTTYGGDGVQTFALPDLRGRTPVHFGANTSLGQQGGEESHTLLASEISPHSHTVLGVSGPATSNTPAGNLLAAKAAARGTSIYDPAPGNPDVQPLAASAINTAGNGQPHSNTQPSLTLMFVIALYGTFPSRN